MRLCVVDYAQSQFRQYSRLIKDIKPDKKAYKDSMDTWGEDQSADSLVYGQHSKVTNAGVDRMVADLHKQYVFPSTHFCLDRLVIYLLFGSCDEHFGFLSLLSCLVLLSQD
jgi:hypothetical protein